MNRKKSAQKIIDQALELNKEYWQSRQSSNVLNPMKHYNNEHLIKECIAKVFSFNKAFNNNEQLDILDTLKAYNVNFDVRSQYEDTTLLYDYAQFYVYNTKNSGKSENKDYLNRMALLLDYGANPDFYRQDKDQQTCLMGSIHDRDRFKLLLDYGADPTFIPNGKWSDITHFISDMLDSIKQRESSKDYNLPRLMLKTYDLEINKDYAQSLIQKKLITDQVNFNQILITSNGKNQNSNKLSNTIVSHYRKQKFIL